MKSFWKYYLASSIVCLSSVFTGQLLKIDELVTAIASVGVGLFVLLSLGFSDIIEELKKK